MTSKTHTDITSADSKSIGFDYQFYHFLYRLLNIKTDESVGLEVKDDIHTELNNDRQVLIQAKFSNQRNSQGEVINLTKYDADLWKTIYNWTKIIVDENDNRQHIDEQLKFINKTDFILTTNKNYKEHDDLLSYIHKLKSTMDIDEFIVSINILKAGTTDNLILSYIKEFLALDKNVLLAFSKNINFDIGNNDIVSLCKKTIKEKFVFDENVDVLFCLIESEIRQRNYFEVIDGKKIIIEFNEVNKLFNKVFTVIRSKEIKETYLEGITIPASLHEQVFIKQLLDIEYLSKDDNETIVKFTKHKYNMDENINRWLTDSDFLSQDLEIFEKGVIDKIETRKLHYYRGITQENDILIKAQNLVDETLSENLKINNNYELSPMLSKGEYFRLTDKPVIGWHKNWEKYKC